MCEIKQGSSVFIPRTKGGESIGTVQQILPAAPLLGEPEAKAYVSWEEERPHSQVHLYSAIYSTPEQCKKMVRVVAGKWVEVKKLRLAT